MTKSRPAPEIAVERLLNPGARTDVISNYSSQNSKLPVADSKHGNEAVTKCTATSTGWTLTDLARIGTEDMGLSERKHLDSIQPGGGYTLCLETEWGRPSSSLGNSDGIEQKQRRVGMSQNSELLFAAQTISV